MHGHGYAPPPQRPTSAQLVVLRVVFVSLALLSCGMLAWTPLLRLAIVTRSTRDWLLCVASGFVMLGSLLLIGAEGSEELDSAQEYLGLFGLLGTAAASVIYYLIAEIRHFNGPAYAAYVPRPTPAPGYGYPAQPGPAQQITRPVGMPPVGPQPGVPAPGPAHGPARIDQVRAELDELSDLLRQKDGIGPKDGRAEGEPR